MYMAVHQVTKIMMTFPFKIPQMMKNFDIQKLFVADEVIEIIEP